MTIIDSSRLDEYVSLETGEIHRQIFSDDEIFEQEMELIFSRAWQFLCHESQIAKKGDFVEVPLGRDNVLVVRQRDGGIKAFINSCTHRGNAVCRAEEGNIKAFMCNYHGWSFDLGGNLIGVPDQDKLFGSSFDKSKYPLRKVEQLENYHGFVFATMDATAPALEDYLGPMGRMAIDLIAARDVEIVPGVQKFVIDCNWKLAVDNLFDWYHAQVTHMSAFSSGWFDLNNEAAPDAGGALSMQGDELALPDGFSPGGLKAMEFLAEYGHAIGGPVNAFPVPPAVAEKLGPIAVQVGGNPNIFPNAWISAISLQISLRIPISADRTEVWWYTFVEKGSTPEERAKQIEVATHTFGPAGLLEQEDGENWAQATLQTRGTGSRRVPQLLKMGHHQGKVIKESGLARIEGPIAEHAQLWTYHSWAQWMKGYDWDELRKATTPPDEF